MLTPLEFRILGDHLLGLHPLRQLDTITAITFRWMAYSLQLNFPSTSASETCVLACWRDPQERT